MCPIPWHKKFLADRSTGCGCSAADQSWGSRQWGAAPEHAPFQRHESRRRPAQWGRAAPPAAAVTHPAVALRASRSRTALSSSPLKRQAGRPTRTPKAMSCVQESNSICQLRGGVRFPFHSIIIGQRDKAEILLCVLAWILCPYVLHSSPTRADKKLLYSSRSYEKSCVRARAEDKRTRSRTATAPIPSPYASSTYVYVRAANASIRRRPLGGPWPLPMWSTHAGRRHAKLLTPMHGLFPVHFSINISAAASLHCSMTIILAFYMCPICNL